jgi:hypothetical protein
MNTLAENFGYISSPWFDFDGWGNMFVNHTILNAYSDIVSNPKVRRNIIKSHYEVHFYLNTLDILLEATDILYIYRNTDDVLKSYRKHLLLRDKRIPTVRCETDSEFAKCEPMGDVLRYQCYQYSTMLDRAVAHVDDWLTLPTEEQRNRIIYVKYEDLNDHFDRVVGEIARGLGYPVPDVIKRPSKGDWHVN